MQAVRTAQAGPPQTTELAPHLLRKAVGCYELQRLHLAKVGGVAQHVDVHQLGHIAVAHRLVLCAECLAQRSRLLCNDIALLGCCLAGTHGSDQVPAGPGQSAQPWWRLDATAPHGPGCPGVATGSALIAAPTHARPWPRREGHAGGSKQAMRSSALKRCLVPSPESHDACSSRPPQVINNMHGAVVCRQASQRGQQQAGFNSACLSRA